MLTQNRGGLSVDAVGFKLRVSHTPNHHDYDPILAHWWAINEGFPKSSSTKTEPQKWWFAILMVSQRWQVHLFTQNWWFPITCSLKKDHRSQLGSLRRPPRGLQPLVGRPNQHLEPCAEHLDLPQDELICCNGGSAAAGSAWFVVDEVTSGWSMVIRCWWRLSHN